MLTRDGTLFVARLQRITATESAPRCVRFADGSPPPLKAHGQRHWVRCAAAGIAVPAIPPERRLGNHPQRSPSDEFPRRATVARRNARPSPFPAPWAGRLIRQQMPNTVIHPTVPGRPYLPMELLDAEPDPFQAIESGAMNRGIGRVACSLLRESLPIRRFGSAGAGQFSGPISSNGGQGTHGSKRPLSLA